MLALIVMALLSGCQALYRQEVRELQSARIAATDETPITNVSIAHRTVTNWSQGSAMSPAVALDITNPVVVQTVSTQVEYAVQPAVTQTNWVPRPEVTGALALAKLAPVPWAGAAGEIGLLLLTGGAALLNRRKLKAAKLGLQAIVTGVEVYRPGKQGAPEAKQDDAALLEALSIQQKALGSRRRSKRWRTGWDGRRRLSSRQKVLRRLNYRMDYGVFWQSGSFCKSLIDWRTHQESNLKPSDP